MMKNRVATEEFIENGVFPLMKLNCASCAARVEKIIAGLYGVKDVGVNFATLTATIHYNSKIISAARIRDAVVNAGYDMVLDEGADADEMWQKEYRDLRTKAILALLFSLPTVIIGMFLMDMPYANEMMWVVSTPVIFWLGRGFFISAVRQLKHLALGMDTLVALSTSIAYLFSVFNTVFPQFLMSRGIHPHVYYEAAAVIITFILLGRLLEARAKANTSKALKSLIGLQPKTVTVIRKVTSVAVPLENYINMPVDEVEVGDIILVKPGERIAVDGVVLEGESYVDESMLSGEPIPVLKVCKEKVFAGTINQKGSIRFIASEIGAQTMLAHIVELVRQAQGSKAPVQKMVDKIAGIFVPTVMGIALLSGIIWFVFGGENGITYGILSMVTVLIIACPCALGLATPTAIMVGIGSGAQNGILIKDAGSLEIAKNVNAVVLDKTGTITEGNPVITNVFWNGEIPDKEIERVLPGVIYSLEKQSEHPLAGAICNYFEHDKKTHSVAGFKSITGKGVEGVVKGKRYMIGNLTLLEENHVYPDKILERHGLQMEREAKTVMWVACDTHVVCLIAVADKLKKGSKRAVKELQQAGIGVYMLTGDQENTAKHIAGLAGVRHYKAAVLPHEKALFVKQLQEQGKIVAMVGDGINDSAALACADIAIAMGKGSDIAMDVAQMTIISGNLMKIPQALKLSARTVSTIRQNLFWAFIYNLIGIPVAAGLLYPFNGFLLNPMIAGAAMALSSVSVVCNSLLLGYKMRHGKGV